jgi:hypothetical protein
MSNVQQVAAKVRHELNQIVPNGVKRYVVIANHISMLHYPDGRFNLQVEKRVGGKRIYESVRGGTVKNIDDMVAAAFGVRGRVYRKAEAYRQKLESTPAPTLTTPATKLTTPASTLTTPASTLTTPAVDSVGKLESSDLAKLLAIGISALAGGMIGWIIGGAL